MTDDDLEIVAEGPDLVVHQPDEVLARMDPFVVDMHTKSGLLEQIRRLDHVGHHEESDCVHLEFAGQGDVLLLRPDSEFFRYLKDPRGGGE